MERGRQHKLLGRLLKRLRGDQPRSDMHIDKSYTTSATWCMFNNQTTACGSGSGNIGNVNNASSVTIVEDEMANSSSQADATIDHAQFAANIDLRYSGQYLTPEQLPEFCEQLHHLVNVIRNIQSYSEITGEYPSELERRLEREARSVAALVAEARNARDVIARARAQRKALKEEKKFLLMQLAGLKESEAREMESTVRVSDRKLFKTWEAVKDSKDLAAFDPLLEEIRTKRTALDCLVRLVEGRKSNLLMAAPQPLPPPLPRDEDSTSRRRHERRYKRRRKEYREPRSEPLSEEPSHHNDTPQVTLYIQGTGSTEGSRYRVGSAGAFISPVELPSRGSVRDILFFTSH